MTFPSHHISVSKTARYHTLGTSDDRTAEIWFVIHGWAQLAGQFLSGFEGLNDGRRYIIAPEALNRFYVKTGQPEVGSTWMTSEERTYEIKDYVSYLNALYDVVVPPGFGGRIVVLGFSQGVATVSRWAYQNERRMDTLVFYAGEPGNELQNAESIATFDKTKNYYIWGLQDRFINDKNVPKLKALLTNFEFISFDGGHEIREEALSLLSSPPALL